MPHRLSTITMRYRKDSALPMLARLRQLMIAGLLATAIALLLLGGIELALRMAGVGHPKTPFVSVPIKGENVLVRNRHYFSSFFPGGLPWMDFNSSRFAVPPEKADDAFRIFVFGGSAPEGWPNPDFSFTRYLDVLLAEAYPDARIEIYNTARKSVNSNVMRVQALQCAREFEPDLFLIYMGNNEVHGPYGLVTQSDGTMDPVMPVWRVRLSIQLLRLRLVQLMRTYAYGTDGEHDPAERWYFYNPLFSDDPRIPEIHDRYRINTTDMVRVARAAGARTILSTLPVNLRDHRPFHTKHFHSLTPDQEDAWNRHYHEGNGLQDAGNFEGALASYEQAAIINDAHGDLQFDMGECLWSLNRREEARPHFERALQYDAYNWVRAKAPLNDTIRELAEDLKPEGVTLVDMEKVVREASPAGCPGHELFLDGCHFSPRGAYIVAREYYRQIHDLLPPEIRGANAAPPEPLAFEECERRLDYLTRRIHWYYDQQMELEDDSPMNCHTPVAIAYMRAELSKSYEPTDPAEALRLWRGDYSLLSQVGPRFGILPHGEDLLSRMRDRYPYNLGTLRAELEWMLVHGDPEEARDAFEQLMETHPDAPDYLQGFSKAIDDAIRIRTPEQ